jgi:hypothetical protein
MSEKASTRQKTLCRRVLTRPRTVIRLGLVEQTTFSAGARLVYFIQTPLLCQTHDPTRFRSGLLIAPIAATDTDNATLPKGRHKYSEEIPMRITILSVVLVAILVGPSAFAQSSSQDNAGQIPNNSGAGVPGLPGNKSGPAHRPDGMTQDAHTPGTSPDQSNVPGLPGTKSGPAVQPPKH